MYNAITNYLGYIPGKPMFAATRIMELEGLGNYSLW